jgi:hypothetical protein
MRLPGGENAVVDLEKLVSYCLNPEHARGKHKARVFARVLGLTAQHAELLRAALLEAAITNDARETHSDQFGDRYMPDFVLRGPRGAGTVRSLWIVRRGESSPRLASCYLR